jgi:hypothetical protein
MTTFNTTNAQTIGDCTKAFKDEQTFTLDYDCLAKFGCDAVSDSIAGLARLMFVYIILRVMYFLFIRRLIIKDRHKEIADKYLFMFGDIVFFMTAGLILFYTW